MNDTEMNALTTFARMDLVCFGDLGNVEIKKAIPNSSAASGESFEFDLFVLFKDYCLVGEISGFGNESDLKKKYRTFRNHFDALKLAGDTRVFDCFALPESDRHRFAQVRRFRAFFIAYKHERYDVDLPAAQDVTVIYSSEWETIKAYSESLGRFAQEPFLDLLGITDPIDISKDLRLEERRNRLMHVQHRMVASDIDTFADVFTFVVAPADLLRIAQVFRRELMPVVAVGKDDRYQRPLDFLKLSRMAKLVSNRDFMFPNNILIALDETCELTHDSDNKLVLRIPMRYGAVSVIDGQHRLFSYACLEVADDVRQNSELLVTALRFGTSDKELMLKSSARAFIEINQQQKRISSAHIDEIAYPVLGLCHSRALAAQVVLRSNQRTGKALHGMFRSSQTTKGVWRAATVIVHLGRIFEKSALDRLLKSSASRARLPRKGYENLFGKQIEDLVNPDELISAGIACLERYFAQVKRVFSADWPERGGPKNSTLEYTKVFSGFVRLLEQFVREGLDWQDVEAELHRIRKNILACRGLDENSKGLVFEKGDKKIPDDQPSVIDTFKFLDANRKKATSMYEI